MQSSQPAALYFKGRRIASGLAKYEPTKSQWVFWPLLRLHFGKLPGSPATLQIMDTGHEVTVTSCEPSLHTHDCWFLTL
jgi:hypothetical protein